jgi:glycosyltransferase involved in cell wall biosynthesis
LKILVLHNQLWSQYKSIVFEKINNLCNQNGDELLVLQTSICEKSRKNLIDFDLNNFNYHYKFVLLNKNYLESTNSFITTIKWIYYILKFKPNIINLTGYSEPGTLFVLLICKFLKIKTIITNESIFYQQSNIYRLNNGIKKSYKSLLFYFTDYFFSYGIQANDFLFRHRVNKFKILSFLNSFDSERLNALSTINNSDSVNKYFLFVGRISAEKNIEFLIQLAVNLKNINSEIEIKIIGDGPEFDQFIKIKNRLKLNNIQFLGSVKWDNLGEYYSNSLGLILPSNFEPWGMVANEAFFYNVPVICSKFCGCADDLVINDFNGIVLPDFSLSLPGGDISVFLNYYLNSRGQFISNIKPTNLIFEPNRLSNELYTSFKMVK